MSRNSSGTFSLPAGNPVVPSNTITSTWANTTLADIKTEITDSLCRSGKGAMLAALQGYDGTVSAPGFTFGTDTDTGLCRVGANNPAMVAGGTARQSWSNTASTFTVPLLEGDGSVSAPTYSFSSESNTGFYFYLVDTDGVIGVAVAGADVAYFGPGGLSVTGGVVVTGAVSAHQVDVSKVSATPINSDSALTGDASAGTGYGASLKGNATSAPLHVEPQASAPTTGAIGDVYANTSGVLFICTVAGTPGTWTKVGTQT